MQQPKPDLVVSDLLQERAPARRLIINVADMSSGSLTLLEALDIADASGIDAEEWQAVMRRGRMSQRARLLYAFGWVVARRVEPDLTYEEVCTYNVEIVGKAAPDAAERSAKRAKAVVAVAALAGVTPDEAENMTLDEVAAVSDLQKRRQRRRAG